MAVIMRTLGTMTGPGVTDPYLLTMWWRPGTVGGSTADATDCLARFRAMWNTLGAKVATGFTATFDPVCITMEDTTGVLQGAFPGTTPTAVTTAGGSSPLPLQTQGVVRFGTSTVINGHRVRGRVYVPAPDEGDNTAASVPSASYTSQLVTAGGSILAPGATASVAVVWHRPGPNGPGASPAITAASAAPVWAVQRKRRS